MKKNHIRQLSNIKLRTKFTLILLISLLFVLTLTTVTSRIPYRAYDEQLYRSGTQTATFFCEKIQSEIDRLTDMSFQMIADDVLQHNLSNLKRVATGSGEWIESRKYISDRIRYFSFQNDFVTTICLKDSQGSLFSTETMGIRLHPLDEETIDNVQRHEGREVWLPDNDNGGLLLLRDIREIQDLTLDSLGTLAIYVDLSAIVDYCNQSLDAMDLSFETAIYSKDNCLYKSGEAFSKVEMEEGDYQITSTDSGPFLFVSHTVPDMDLRYVMAVPYGQVQQDIRSASLISLSLACLAFAIALGFGTATISSILKHLQVLLGKFESFAKGDLSNIPSAEYIDRNDEIGVLHRQFDKMAIDYDRMMKDNYETQILLKDTQLQQLRAQIRPHFLYNTIESIYCLAYETGHQRLIEMVGAFGNMVRSTISDHRDIITLAEDWEIAREYLRIQAISYQDRLKIEYEVDEKYNSVLIPSMTLQPLVENAIHYAAEEMLETCVISIFSVEKENHLEIIVQDNGPGIDEDILEKLETGEVTASGIGIGLRNINRRIELAFSEEYGLEFRRQEDHTQVVIRLPYGADS